MAISITGQSQAMGYWPVTAGPKPRPDLRRIWLEDDEVNAKVSETLREQVRAIMQRDPEGFDQFTAMQQYKQGLSDMSYEQRQALMKAYRDRLKAQGHALYPNPYKQHLAVPVGTLGVRG